MIGGVLDGECRGNPADDPIMMARLFVAVTATCRGLRSRSRPTARNTRDGVYMHLCLRACLPHRACAQVIHSGVPGGLSLSPAMIERVTQNRTAPLFNHSAIGCPVDGERRGGLTTWMKWKLGVELLRRATPVSEPAPRLRIPCRSWPQPYKTK